MAIARAALARSFDVLALTPKEQAYRCWDTEWPDTSEDVPRVSLVRVSPLDTSAEQMVRKWLIVH